MADADAIGRVVLLAFQSGIPLMEIHRQLRGISSDRAVGLGPNKALSMPDADATPCEFVAAAYDDAGVGNVG